jgi:hypothetical protein
VLYPAVGGLDGGVWAGGRVVMGELGGGPTYEGMSAWWFERGRVTLVRWGGIKAEFDLGGFC